MLYSGTSCCVSQYSYISQLKRCMWKGYLYKYKNCSAAAAGWI